MCVLSRNFDSFIVHIYTLVYFRWDRGVVVLRSRWLASSIMPLILTSLDAPILDGNRGFNLNIRNYI